MGLKNVLRYLFLNDSTTECEECFLKKRDPSLSNDEIQMCMLIRIGLSNEDMANIYCITVNSMKRKLYSFKEKMGITDKDQSVRNVILGL